MKNLFEDSKDSVDIYNQDIIKFLRSYPKNRKVDLVVSSPPYNIGKEYEKRIDIENYLSWKKEIIELIVPIIKSKGSLCWQVGNYIKNGSIAPLDILLHETFIENGLILRNRIVWTFGHGTHAKKRFSGRYEVIMWYTKSDDYIFNLDDVRIPSKYPNKRYYKGNKKGQISSNPLGKNPEDVWNIPNVKSNHIEKTSHPCQFPIALVERLVMALTNKGGTVFDPFMGVGSSGLASIIHQRKFVGVEIDKEYFKIAKDRISSFYSNELKYRPLNKPIYNPES